jgi:hypothetical protein
MDRQDRSIEAVRAGRIRGGLILPAGNGKSRKHARHRSANRIVPHHYPLAAANAPHRSRRY